MPNLLIIHTDEHNFRTLGCYRKTLSPEQALMWGKGAVVETPNIDWIAENGALCTSFYASTPVCSPSRASFVSGKYPQNTPVVTNNIALDDDIVTFAEILKGHGFATGYSGKWHIDGDGKPQWAPKRQFGFKDNRYMFNRGHWKKLAITGDGPVVDTGNKPTYDVEGATAENFTTDWLADRTIEFIENHVKEPFCYMVSIPDPHGPDRVRAPYDTMYEGMKFDKPRNAIDVSEEMPSWARPSKGNTRMPQYYGMVKCIDDNVGRILDCLRKHKLIEDTIIVFTADHGDLCGEHNRHNKGVPLEGSAKVPFLIYWPSRIKAGTIVKEALSTTDFAPTILGLMAIATKVDMDGRESSGLFTGRVKPGDWRDITFVRGTGRADKAEGWVAAFTGRYKLILSSKDEPWLIDLEKDPDELRNFIDEPECRDVARSLASALVEYGKLYNDVRVAEEKVASELEELSK